MKKIDKPFEIHAYFYSKMSRYDFVCNVESHQMVIVTRCERS